jgi:SP family sugar:H+ symporter-like MFS transporter
MMMNKRFVTTVAAGAALGGLLFGYDTSTMNAAIVGLRASLGLSSGQVGLVAAISLLGCAAGAWLAGPTSVRLGRSRIMLVAGALVALGSLGVALGSGVLLIAPCRVLTGLGIGAASAVVPPYITEISPKAMRGRLGSLWQFAIVSGQLLGLLVDFGITTWAGAEAAVMPWGGAAWRWMFAAVAVLAIAYVLTARTLPRSPQDLVDHGRVADAVALLSRIADPEATERIAEMKKLENVSRERVSLRDLRGPRFGLLAVVWVGILLAAFQQLVGINVVKTYSNIIWNAAGFSTATTFLFSIVTVVISVVSTMIAIGVIDRVGRRTMLLTGAAVMTVALVVLAISFSSMTGSGSGPALGHSRGIAALIAVNVFAIAFGITWGPVMWVMLSELFDSRIQSMAVAVCTALNWLTNWAVTRTFPLLADVGLGFAYSLYAAFAILALLFVWKALPETRGRTLV